MEELKPCDITLLEKRLKNLSAGLKNMDNGDIMVNRAMLTACRDYMAELLTLRRAEPENKPLTLKELPCFEPIYVVPLGSSVGEWSAHWCIYQIDNATAKSDTHKGRMWFLYDTDYGKTWLAYARKPERSEAK